MRVFLVENAATMVVCLLLLAAVAAVIVHMVKNRKAGKTSCGCNCGGCPMKNGCEKQQKKKDENIRKSEDIGENPS